MPRDIPVGNGVLLVTFDQDYCIKDIYFPHVGKENHSNGHGFRCGIWTDGMFEWINRGWELSLAYEDETIMSRVSAVNRTLEIGLRCSDIVDYKENAFLKRIVVQNNSDREREVRLFFHHDYHILESSLANTAFYDPEEKAVIHYKGNRYFLMSGIRRGEHGLDQYTAGRSEFQGLEGTWRDAEDGVLSGNPIAQGSVDSTISFSVNVKPGGEETLYYWICVGSDFAQVSDINRIIVRNGPESLIRRTSNYWKAWANKEETDLSKLSPEVGKLYKRSLLIMRTNIDSGGAIIAGTDSDINQFARDTYSYMWPRDGALISYALDMAGYLGITRRFFSFCHDILSRGKEANGYFLHKYNPDGSLGSSWHPWTSVDKGGSVSGRRPIPFGRSNFRWLSEPDRRLPIQEDGTGLVLWSLWYHFSKFRDIEFVIKLYDSLILRCGDFLASYRDLETGLPFPSYDLWEESWGIHTFTASAVYAGITAAAKFAAFLGDREKSDYYSAAADQIREGMGVHLYSTEHQRFAKSIVMDEGSASRTDMTVDASLYAPFYFGVFGARDDRVVRTMEAVKRNLWVNTAAGGVARYEGDQYQRVNEHDGHIPGNPWFICTLWLAQWIIARAETSEELEEAVSILEWTASKAMPSGVLAEQVDPYTGHPISVSPLTWSHAAFVTTVIEYLEKVREIELCPTCHMHIVK